MAAIVTRSIMIAIEEVKDSTRVFRIGITTDDDKHMRVIRAEEGMLRNFIQEGKVFVENLAVVDGELVGTNGGLDRYTRLRRGYPIGPSPMVVISKLGELGYRVADFEGKMLKLTNEKAAEYADSKSGGIANGKVVNNNGVKYISSIYGNYVTEDLSKGRNRGGKLGGFEQTGTANIAIPITTGGGTGIERSARVSIENSLESNDVFRSINQSQRRVMKDYYVWYTVDMFLKLAKSIRLMLAPGKLEKLTVLRGTKDWQFDGMWDTGFTGASHCSLGHALRYEYYAIPVGEKDENLRIVFGQGCASDFFEIDKESMEKLIKVQEAMSRDIEMLTAVVSEGLEQEFMEKTELLNDIVKKMGGNYERCATAFGQQVGAALINFRQFGLPYPLTLVDCALEAASENPKKFFTAVFPEYSSLIAYVFDSGVQGAKWLKKYLMHIASNRLAGYWAYNPNDDQEVRVKKGRNGRAFKYNDETRTERRILEYDIQTKICTSNERYSFDGLHTILEANNSLLNLVGGCLKKLPRVMEEMYNRSNIFDIHLRDSSTLGIDKNTANLISAAVYYSIDGRVIVLDMGNSRSWYVRQMYNRSTLADLKNMTDVMKTNGTLERVVDGLEDIYNKIVGNIRQSAEAGGGAVEKAKAEAMAVNVEDEYKPVKTVEKKKEIIEEQPKEDKQSEENKQPEAVKQAEETLTIEGEKVIKYLSENIGTRPELDEQYGAKIAKAILEKRLKWNKYTSSQRWRLTETYKMYAGENQVVVEYESKENEKTITNAWPIILANNPGLENSMKDIINFWNKSNGVAKIVLADAIFSIKVIKTALGTGKVTENQYKFIEAASKLYTNYMKGGNQK